MGRCIRHHARRVHGCAGHPDHELILARHLPRDRGDARRRLLDLHCLFGGRNRYDRAHCLVRKRIHRSLLPCRKRVSFPDVQRAVRNLYELGSDDCVPRGTGIYRRRFYPHGSHRYREHNAEKSLARRSSDVRDDSYACTGHWSGAWWLAHGPFRMGMEFLCQLHSGRAHAGIDPVRR